MAAAPVTPDVVTQLVSGWGMGFAGVLLQALVVLILLAILLWLAYAQLSYPKKFPFIKWKPFLVWITYANGLTLRKDKYALQKQGLGGLEDVGRVKSEPDARIMPILMQQIFASQGMGGIPVSWRPHKGEFYPCELLTAPNNKAAIEAISDRDALVKEQIELVKQHEALEKLYRDTKDEAEKKTLEERAKDLVAQINDLTKQAEKLTVTIQKDGRPIFHPIIPPGAKKWAIGKSRETIMRHVKKTPWEQLALLGAAIVVIVGAIFTMWLVGGVGKDTAEINLRAQAASIAQVRNITGLCQDYCVGYVNMYCPNQITQLEPIQAPVLPPGG